MAKTAGQLDSLSAAERGRLESLLLDFDRSWTPEITYAQLAQGTRSLGEEATLQGVALAELVKIDLERRWRSGRRRPLEEYLEEFPQLGTPETVAPELIQAEFITRQECGETLSMDELRERFPQQSAAAEELIARSEQARLESQAGQANIDTSHAEPMTALESQGEYAEDAAGALPEQFGRYRIRRPLGRGAMGAVYLAYDENLERDVALKTPSFTGQNAAMMVERFYREARSAAKLRHPNICPVHDVGEIEGVHFISMAYIDGRPLSDLARKEGGIPERNAAVLVRKLALGLAHAHAHGVVHRDLKPANVMIDRQKDPVVMDFGLALREDAADEARVTKSGMMLGTPAYMSPEQVEGLHEKIGPSTDIYALGVILYELLTGRLPFEGSVGAVIGQVMTRQPEPPSALREGIDEDLESICLKMMDKEVEERYPSMDEVAEELKGWLTVHRGQRSTDSAAPEMVDEDRPHPDSLLDEARRPSPEGRGEAGPGSVVREARRLVSGGRGKWIAAAAGGLLLLVLSLVFLLPTPHGTLEVRVEEGADVQVLINGKTIDLRDSQWTNDVPAEEHTLALKIGGVTIPFDAKEKRFVADGGKISVMLGKTELRGERFEVARGGNTVLTIGFVPEEERPPAPSGIPQPQLISQFQHGATKGNRCYFAVLSPDGGLVAYRMTNESPMKMFETASQQEVELPEMVQNALKLDYNANGSLFATGHPDGTVRLWNSQTFEAVGRPFLTAADEGIRWVSLSDDGSRLLALASGQPPTFRAWNIESHEMVTEPFSLGIDSKAKGVHIAASADALLLAVAFYERGSDHLVQIWDVKTGRPRETQFVPMEDDLGTVFSIDLSPRGDQLAVATKDGKCFLFDAATGKQIMAATHAGRVVATRFSPDGRQLATSCGTPNSEHMYVWDVATKEERVRWNLPTDDEFSWTEKYGANANHLVFSNDGSRLLTAGVNTPVCVWKLETSSPSRGEPLIIEAGIDCRQMTLSPDGIRLAVTGESTPGEVTVWNTLTGEKLNRYRVHDEATKSLTYSPDGRSLLFSSGKVVKVIDAETGREDKTFDFSSSRMQFAVFPRRSWAVALDYDREPTREELKQESVPRLLKVWDWSTGEVLHQQHVNPADEDVFRTLHSPAISPDERHLTVAQRHQHVRYKIVVDGDKVTLEDPTGFERTSLALSPLFFSPDGKYAATSLRSNKSLFDVVEVESGRVQHQFDAETAAKAAGSYGCRLAFTPDSRRIVSADYNGRVALWDRATGKLVRELHTHEPDGRNNWTNAPGVVITPDGQLITGGGATDRRIIIRPLVDVPQPIETAAPANPPRLVHRFDDRDTNYRRNFVVAFSPQGALVDSAHENGHLRNVSLATGEVQPPEFGDMSFVRAVGWSADGSKFIAARSRNDSVQEKVVQIWERGKDRPTHEFEFISRMVRSAALSPDGNRAVVVAVESIIGRDGKYVIHHWDLTGNKPARQFSVPYNPTNLHSRVISVDISRDAKLVAAAYQNGIDVWDVATSARRHRIEFEGERGSATLVKFTGSGSEVFWGVSAGRMYLTNVETGKTRQAFDHGSDGRGIVGIAIAADETLVAAANGRRATVWETKTGNVLRTWPLPKSDEKVLVGYPYSFLPRHVVFSPDGRYLVTAGHNTPLCVWDLQQDAPDEELSLDAIQPGAENLLAKVDLNSPGKTGAWSLEDGQLTGIRGVRSALHGAWLPLGPAPEDAYRLTARVVWQGMKNFDADSLKKNWFGTAGGNRATVNVRFNKKPVVQLIAMYRNWGIRFQPDDEALARAGIDLRDRTTVQVVGAKLNEGGWDQLLAPTFEPIGVEYHWVGAKQDKVVALRPKEGYLSPGIGRVGFALPWSKSELQLALIPDRPEASGLIAKDGTRVGGLSFEKPLPRWDDTSHAVVIDAHGDDETLKLTVAVDGQQLVSWQGDVKHLKAIPNHSRTISVFVRGRNGTTARFDRIEALPVENEFQQGGEGEEDESVEAPPPDRT